jgi:hypothetical protein
LLTRPLQTVENIVNETDIMVDNNTNNQNTIGLQVSLQRPLFISRPTRHLRLPELLDLALLATPAALARRASCCPITGSAAWGSQYLAPKMAANTEVVTA